MQPALCTKAMKMPIIEIAIIDNKFVFYLIVPVSN